MYTHHKLDHEFTGSPPPTTSYMVCSLPRSGSSLLCELLMNTGLAGAPTEYFDRAQMEMFQRFWGNDGLDDYVATLLAKKTSPNGVFGFKVHYHQLMDAFPDRSVWDMFPGLQLVYIRRADQIGQAVSFAKATQSEQWASDHAPQSHALTFDDDEIRELLEWIRREERLWQGLFREWNASPLEIVYEDLVASMDATVIEVLKFLGIEVPPDFRVRPPSLRRQADELSERWKRRYLELHPDERQAEVGREPPDTMVS